MKFFEEHFTRHHFRHNPHKWLSALLLSPIHHAEMRYKQHYHLRFAHAKKLFAFDMVLLLSTVLILGATIFWWLYDPTVTALVHLDVEATGETDRHRSGEEMMLAISIHNSSDVTLVNPRLSIVAPAGFLFTDASLPYDTNEHKAMAISLEQIAPGSDVSLTVNGYYFGPVDEHESLQTMLIYTQEGKATPESDIHRLLLTAREPSIGIDVAAQLHAVPNVSSPITLTITNYHDRPSLPIFLQANDTLSLTLSDVTTTDESVWDFDVLKPNEVKTISGSLIVPASVRENQTTLSLTTQLLIQNEVSLREQTYSTDISIARPDVAITSSWSDSYGTLGSNELLTLRIANTGNVTLETGSVSYGGQVITLPEPLVPNATLPVTLSLPVSQAGIADGQDGPVFVPEVTFSGTIAGVPGYTYTEHYAAEPLPIGTTVSLSQSARYYTAEGDQLGRGPLPPQVGKETTYWVFTTVKNTVGEIREAVFSTTLAPGVRWTGKSSVSRGSDITYDPATGNATWRSNLINPYETVGIYFEVGVTPVSGSIGSVPALTSGASFSAFDPYVEQDLFASSGDVNASLAGDSIGQARGVLVQ